MTPERFQDLTKKYAHLRIAVVGDFCLDRYLEIDRARSETSLETGLAVHNVVAVRAEPGAAGTVLNNLVALGVGEVIPIGFCGEDGEGFELQRALELRSGVRLNHFFATSLRRTFTYCKPLLVEAGQAPRELNRLDTKNWTATPNQVCQRVLASVEAMRSVVDSLIVMDQVDVPETGVVTSTILSALENFPESTPVIADARRGLRAYPCVIYKMNGSELGAMMKLPSATAIDVVKDAAGALATQNRRPVFITLSERGIVGAEPGGEVHHVPALALRGPIDVVGAGDSVTANLATALAAGATVREAIELAAVAASIVIHKLGSTGTASVDEIAELMFSARRS